MKEWFATNWFEFLQTIGIIATLFFTGITYVKNIKVTKATAILNITHAHRELFGNIYNSAKHRRVFERDIKITFEEITAEEYRFASMLIMHFQESYLCEISGVALL